MPFTVYGNFQALDLKILFGNFHKGCLVQYKTVQHDNLFPLTDLHYGSVSQAIFVLCTPITPSVNLKYVFIDRKPEICSSHTGYPSVWLLISLKWPYNDLLKQLILQVQKNRLIKYVSFCLMRHLYLFAKDLTFLAQKNYQNIFFYFFFTILLKSNTIKL